nr:peptidase M61 [Aquimarina sp. MMG016]
MRRRIPLIYCILAIAISSCKTTQPNIEIGDIPILASIDLVNVVNDKVKVELEVANFDQDTISYYLPKIVPGTYQNNNYGKFIDNFKAFDQDGSPLYVQKYGDNRWKINNVKRLRKISYWVNDTFDTEDEHDIFSPTGTNIVKDDIFILNLYAFIGYFDQMKEQKYKLLIKHPKQLEASTSLIKTPSKIIPDASSPIETDQYNLKRYADLADSPIMYSKPDKVTFSVNDITVLLSVYTRNKLHRAAKIMPQMERVIRAQKNFLGDINSTKNYSILLYLSSSKSNDAKGFGALEHNTSTVVVLPESLSQEKLDESLTDVVSHEFFHIVTPLTIQSEEIYDFDYNKPKMSQHLWLYEGTTEYFSLLFQISQGLISKEEFYNRILEKIEAAKYFDNSMSFTEMSKNILKEPYRQNYRNVYEKGALISMCIDIILRENSEGQTGILDLIKALSNTFGSEMPFKDDELIKIIKKIPSPEVAAFLEKHVVGNTPIDYEYYLNKLGLQFGKKEVPSSYFLFEQEPYIKGSEATKEVIFAKGVTYNTFLKNLGVQGGDALISINDKKYTIKNIYDLFGDSNKWKVGNDITFKVKRNGEVITLTTKVIEPKVQQVVIQQNPSATKQQTNILKKWIND